MCSHRDTLFRESQSTTVLAFTVGLLLSGAVYCSRGAYIQSEAGLPKVEREFRGAWVASVGNIDWPSTNAVGSAQQQGELLAILDRAARLGLNAVILQVRPSCDALYASSIEPWSEYLTGTMGKALRPTTIR
jgi:uncharacterized lipoprotein YddW (UPF0748 family)